MQLWTATPNLAARAGTLPAAVTVVLDGITPAQLAGAVPAPVFSGPLVAIPGLSLTPSQDGPRWQDPAALDLPQRLAIPFDVTLAPLCPDAFPAAAVELRAAVTIAGEERAAAVSLTLEAADHSPGIDGLRVFTVTPGVDDAPVPGGGALTPATGVTGLDAAAGRAYLRSLITMLERDHAEPDGIDPFAGLLPDDGATALCSVEPSLPDPAGGDGLTGYTFAIARVRLAAGATADVRFRLSAAPSADPRPAGGLTLAEVRCPAGPDRWAYAGCFVNLSDPAHTATVAGEAVPVNTVLLGTHHTLIAECAGSRAVRAVQVSPVAPAARATAHAFELPDGGGELVIDWGDVPIGACAAVTWPGGSTARLEVTRGVSYLPIPVAAGPLAGVLSIDLPARIQPGRWFTATVRRAVDRDGRRELTAGYRLSIPVRGERAQLPGEQSVLAILRRRLAQTPLDSPAYLALAQCARSHARRVDALGGAAAAVAPSLRGHIALPTLSVAVAAPPERRRGRVADLRYDRLGAFEGFELITDEGRRRAYRGCASTLEPVIRRAWHDHVQIEVEGAVADHITLLGRTGTGTVRRRGPDRGGPDRVTTGTGEPLAPPALALAG